MLRWLKPQSEAAGEIDEHSQPTEPVPLFPDEALLPTLPGASSSPPPLILPAPQQQEQPFPQQYVGNSLPPQYYQPQPYAENGMSPQSYQPQYAQGVPAIPYAAAPAPQFGRRRGRKQRWQPGIPVAALPVPVQPEPAPVGRRQRQPARRSPIPALVRLFFIIVQLTLVARLVLKIVNPAQPSVWIDIIYALSSLFLIPALALLQQVKLPFTVGIELYILPALLLYAVFSRILVKILRVFL